MPKKTNRPDGSYDRPVEVKGSVATYGRGPGRRRAQAEEVQAELYRQKAEVFRALGQPVRLRIVEALSSGELTVSQLGRTTGASQPNLSKHLALLRRVGIVEARKQGVNVFYRLKLQCIGNFFTCVTDALRERTQEAADLARHL